MTVPKEINYHIVKICKFVAYKKTKLNMNDFIYTIGDLFEASFEILVLAGNLPNLLLGIVGAGALYFCGKISVAEKNIIK